MIPAKEENGFSLLQIIVALALFTLAIVMVVSLYSLSNRTYNKASRTAEMAQNARVALNRMTREIRQSPQIITDLSSDRSGAKSEIMFRDGHDLEETTYINYYLDDTDLRRSEWAYYFPSEENIYVEYNARDEDGDSPEKKVLSDHLVGEYFQNMEFWGTQELVKIYFNLKINGEEFEIGSSVYSRN